ncbi:divalent-cation tolerance protein CutA [Polynucleobacter sp. CS-Odin-A6]|uniref:divalent-cation tolerance protein CutA n=1 Tax=Polynucleobacter sp. CS-Odin-A6 TaxID=2689106 RepID=UPI001C0C15BC|nr:divalent-cation tolerance protein CutA [Polynucleobacter sp. CS-Odin-A6]MBU3621367.1 divalent-cation tolerance protein CutA [Polynucleobacter sp. CS-Odin-A6]
MTQDHLSEILIVVTSFSRLEDAQVMARQLIEHRLAACVQMQQGIHSIYRWEGQICEEFEVLLSAKTVLDKWDEIAHFIESQHPYDLPELIAYTPEKYSAQYGNWVEAEVKSLP